MIRLSTKDDLPGLMKLATAMHLESGYRHLIFDADKVRGRMGRMINDEKCLALVAVEDNAVGEGDVYGMLWAMVNEYLFGRDLLASDMGLYVRPDKRGATAGARLVVSFELWAREKGAKEAQIAVTSGINDETVGKLLEGLSFRPSGTAYKRSL